MTDARILRTRATLNRAILKLASEKPLPSITVSELAAEAGINRVTFYKHFNMPAEALNAALSVELDEIRARFLAGYEEVSTDPVEPLRASMIDVLDHMDRHRRLYELAVENPTDGTLLNLLTDYFTESLDLYLKIRSSLQPALPEGLDLTMLSSFYAHGFVGCLKTLVKNGWVADRETFLASIVSLAPGWWFPAQS